MTDPCYRRNGGRAVVGLGPPTAVGEAFIDVNETGTEPAAVSASTMKMQSIEIPQPRIFHAHHPFLGSDDPMIGGFF